MEVYIERELAAHAIFALAKEEENQDDCVCGD